MVGLLCCLGNISFTFRNTDTQTIPQSFSNMHGYGRLLFPRFVIVLSLVFLFSICNTTHQHGFISRRYTNKPLPYPTCMRTMPLLTFPSLCYCPLLTILPNIYLTKQLNLPSILAHFPSISYRICMGTISSYLPFTFLLSSVIFFTTHTP